MWECVGGSVLKGESSLQGAVREVREKVGIDLIPEKGKLLFSEVRKQVASEKFNDILDVYIFEYNGEVDLKKATTDEVAQTKWLSKDKIKQLYDEHKLVWTLQYFLK